MSEKSRMKTAPEVRGEGAEAVASVRRAVEKILKPKIASLCRALKKAKRANGKLDTSEIERLEELARSVWESTLQSKNILLQDFTLLLLKSVSLLSEVGCDLSKIKAILTAVRLLQKGGLKEDQVAEADRNLKATGLDVVVEVPGLAELYEDDGGDEGDEESDPLEDEPDVR